MASARRYSSNERSTAIDRTLEMGAAVVGGGLGIPTGTLSC